MLDPIERTACAEGCWDASADVLYVGGLGADTLHGFEFDGAQRWSAELAGGITALASMGTSGSAAVSIELADGSGEFVVVNGVTGVLSEDLRPAALAARDLDRRACREHALRYTWEAATRQFAASLALVDYPHAATIS